MQILRVLMVSVRLYRHQYFGHFEPRVEVRISRLVIDLHVGHKVQAHTLRVLALLHRQYEMISDVLELLPGLAPFHNFLQL